MNSFSLVIHKESAQQLCIYFRFILLSNIVNLRLLADVGSSWCFRASIFVLSHLLGQEVWPTLLPSHCLWVVCWPQTLADMGSSYFCIRSAFINISLLGDKLMSPGSLIATSQLFRHFFVLVHGGCSTSHAVDHIHQAALEGWGIIYFPSTCTVHRAESRLLLMINTMTINDNGIICCTGLTLTGWVKEGINGSRQRKQTHIFWFLWLCRATRIQVTGPDLRIEASGKKQTTTAGHGG